MTVRMRHTRGHTRNRRAHHALKDARFSTCANCGATHKRHAVCDSCGQYRGRQVLDVAAQTARKLERKNTKAKALGQEPEKVAEKAS